MKKKNIAIVGSGGHAASCFDILDNLSEYEVIGYIDYKKNIDFFDLNYLGNDDNFFSNFPRDIKILIGIGQINDPIPRKNIFLKYKKNGFEIPTVISSNAIISKYSKIEDGCIIMNNTIINSKVKIGNNCIINNNSLIEHGSVIGNNCHISTGSIVNGDVVIGCNSFIGSNSTIDHGITISNNSFIPSHAKIKNNI